MVATLYNPLSYRPISLTSVCCKMMERILADHIYGYLEINSLLSDAQFGYRRSRSTEDQLLITYGCITQQVDSGMLVDLAMLDFSKAFDVLNHAILLQQLFDLGISHYC